jgi:hypothetical protein
MLEDSTFVLLSVEVQHTKAGIRLRKSFNVLSESHG